MNIKKENACRFISAKIKFYCGYLNKEVETNAEDFSGWEAECDLCGSHSGVNVTCECECGNVHRLSVTSD